ncbi:MAG: site-specific DNA-methyltransferase [Candidatus Nealsonbacteria bacterium]|nr:site-specific DNA-methyltransferase [Candidatus Nealsonbacteria bacterium]
MDLINTIVLCDCIIGMRELSKETIPLTVTSPPYDNLRDYGKHGFNFEAIANELYRITMQGGVVVWVVQDQIKKGSETGTSAWQQLYFQRIGFRIHHRMVMLPLGNRNTTPVRYGNALQFALVLSKGRPRYVNLIRDKRNATGGQAHTYNQRTKDGRIVSQRTAITRTWGPREPVWTYAVGGCHTTEDAFTSEHPAMMPEAMAADHIISWSRPGDLVFDPMCGAATTCKMALLNHRRYLGLEIHERYFQIAQERMRRAREQHRRDLDEYCEV